MSVKAIGRGYIGHNLVKKHENPSSNPQDKHKHSFGIQYRKSFKNACLQSPCVSFRIYSKLTVGFGASRGMSLHCHAPPQSPSTLPRKPSHGEGHRAPRRAPESPSRDRSLRASAPAGRICKQVAGRGGDSMKQYKPYAKNKHFNSIQRCGVAAF